MFHLLLKSLRLYVTLFCTEWIHSMLHIFGMDFRLYDFMWKELAKEVVSEYDWIIRKR